MAAEVASGRKLKVLRTNNGGEFTVVEFAAYCADEGIKRHFSAPYSPQQNGVVERRNQTVVAMARALLRMPSRFLGGGCDDGGAHFESISDEGTEECYSL
jgi:transposase InsO family protein